MTSFLKTAYQSYLFPIDESVDKKINPYLKNPRAPPVAENEADFFLVEHIFQHASVSLCLHQLTKISRSLQVKYSNTIYQ